jgi:DHA2 family multidrug resistance protein
LPNYLRTEGTAILTLVRNVGSSVGISMVIAELTNTTIRMHAHLSEYVTPFNDALRAPDMSRLLDTTSNTGRALLEGMLTQQATIIAYANDFKLLMYLAMATLPLIFFIGTSRTAPQEPGGDAASAAHAFE